MRAADRSGALVVFDMTEGVHAAMTAHLADWADDLIPGATGLFGPQSIRIAGLEAATARFAGRDAGFRLVAIALGSGRAGRFLFAAPSEDFAARDGLFRRTVSSFRRLSDDEASRAVPRRVGIVEVQPDDTVDSLAALMAYDTFRRDRFMVLNGLRSDADLEPGMLVKVIRRQ